MAKPLYTVLYPLRCRLGQGTFAQKSNWENENAIEALAAKAHVAVVGYSRARDAIARLLPDDFTPSADRAAVDPESCAAAAEVASLLELGSNLVHTDTLGAVAVFEAAAACGNPDAQFTVGALASVGLFGLPEDHLQSSLMLHFAALGHNEHATIAQAFRAFHGIGGASDCDAAAEHYMAAADSALAARARAGAAPDVQRQRLTVEQLGGVAGLNELEAPKQALSGLVREAERLSQQAESATEQEYQLLPQQMAYVWREAMAQLNTALRSAYRAAGGWQLEDGSAQLELVEYFKHLAATQGDANAHIALGHIHYYGLRGQPHDYSAAVDHFMAAAEATGVLDEPAAGATHEDESEGSGDRDMRLMAMAMLGECYVTGRGVQPDVTVAMDFLVPAVQARHPVAMNAMAVLVLRGEADYGFTVATFPQPAAPAASADAKDEKDPVSVHSAVKDKKAGLSADLDPRNPVHRRRVALALLHQATAAGHTSAMHNLGMVYMAAEDSAMHGLQPQSEASVDSGGAVTTAAVSANKRAVQKAAAKGKQRPSRRVWQRSFEKARKYFGLAAQNAFLPSLHALGHLSVRGLGGTPSCKAGVRLLRGVVHRGPAALILDTAYARLAAADINAARFELIGFPALASGFGDSDGGGDSSPVAGGVALVGAGKWAAEVYHGKGVEALRGALLQYLRLAAMGFEIAQSNAATILHRFGAPTFQPKGMRDMGQGAYTTLLQLAAKQGNVEAHVKLGDVLHRGALQATPAPAAAAVHYRTAADMGSGQALYNLGTMHEYGDGLPVDFFLAKRYYDMARAADSSAWVPITLALETLRVKSIIADWMQANHESCKALHASVPYLDLVTGWIGFAEAFECKQPRPEHAAEASSTQDEAASKTTPGASKPESLRSSRMSAAIEAANKRKRIHRKQTGMLGKMRNYILQAALELKRTGRLLAREGWSSLEPEDRFILQLLALTVLLYILRRLRG